MGFTAGRQARRAVECLEYILAIELLAGAQALEFHRPLQPGRGVRRAYEVVRGLVPALDGDRVLTGDIETLRASVRAGTFAAIATQSIEPSPSPAEVPARHH
jgi:histidine ammonia-lyase